MTFFCIFFSFLKCQLLKKEGVRLGVVACFSELISAAHVVGNSKFVVAEPVITHRFIDGARYFIVSQR